MDGSTLFLWSDDAHAKRGEASQWVGLVSFVSLRRLLGGRGWEGRRKRGDEIGLVIVLGKDLGIGWSVLVS